MTNSEDGFSIMLATDIHLGVNEKDGIRDEDSFTTFEEILRISKERDVDFILLGGDLFHDNIPSPQCNNKCMALLRKYCMGDKPIDFELLSDQHTIFKNSEFPTVNYEDPNFNISIPVFSIHGNHDDPSGFGRKSALDLLSVSGYVNYFGKWTDLNQVKVYPLIFKKGTSKLAIYGLSHIKDERLYRLMKLNEVEYVLPDENPKDFFNLMVLHQNRVDRPGTKHIPESLLPSFLDLVMWGHEHDCRITPEWNQDKQFYVTQPGSSVATSLCEGEALPKSVAILKIIGRDFKLEPVPLKTVRPFVFDSVALSDWNMRLGNNPSDKIQEYVDRYIRSTVLEKANDLITDDEKQPKLPIVRLRIEYEREEECFNVIRFGQTFTGLVANPSDMVALKKKMKETRQPRKGVNRPDDPADSSTFHDINLAIPELMQQYFDGVPEKSRLKVLSRISMSEAVSRFIDKDDKDALDDVVNYEMKKVRDYLEKENSDPDGVTTLLHQYNEMKLNANQKEELEEVRRFLDSESRYERDIPAPNNASRPMELSSDDEDAFGPPASSFNNTASTRGKGRGSGRGRGTRAAARRRGGARSSAADRTILETSRTSLNTTKNNTSARSSRSIARYLIQNEDDNGDSANQNSEEMFTASGYKPSPKKKMKFSFIDE